MPWPVAGEWITFARHKVGHLQKILTVTLGHKLSIVIITSKGEALGASRPDHRRQHSKTRHNKMSNMPIVPWIWTQRNHLLCVKKDYFDLFDAHWGASEHRNETELQNKPWICFLFWKYKTLYLLYRHTTNTTPPPFARLFGLNMKWGASSM